jgi:hypothetical protein
MLGMTDSTETVVKCHFFDVSSGQGRNPNSKCEGDAKAFVRKSHDKRLCPLCSSCKETFARAQKEMDEKVKESIPGHGAFEDVDLSPESIAEFHNQKPKEKASAG